METELHELLGRINALEAMVMAFAAATILHTRDDEPEQADVEAFLDVVRRSVETRTRSSEAREQSLKAIEELNARLKTSMALLYSPQRPHA